MEFHNFFISCHRNNGFVEIFKYLARANPEIILLNPQNNCVGRSNWLMECQNTLQYFMVGRPT